MHLSYSLLLSWLKVEPNLYECQICKRQVFMFSLTLFYNNIKNIHYTDYKTQTSTANISSNKPFAASEMAQKHYHHYPIKARWKLT